MRIVRNAAIGMSLISLAFAGAASAEDRLSRGSATVESESDLAGPGIILAVLAAAAIIAAIVIAAGGGDDGPLSA